MENEKSTINTEELANEKQSTINQVKDYIDADGLKEETRDTINQVKTYINEVDFKKETQETKNFLKNMIVAPFETIKRIATGEENVFSKVIAIMILYLVASLTYEIVDLIDYGRHSDVLDNIMDLVTSITYPLFKVLVIAFVVFIFNKTNKKSLITVISTIVVAHVPTVASAVLDLIENLVSGISILTSPIITTLSAITTVFVYFGIKDLLGIEEHKDYIKKYAIIRLVAAYILLILVRIGIA